MPTDDIGYSCHYTNLSVDTKAFIALMKKLEASPVAVLTPLFSRALRRCLPEGVNKVVESAITIDCRGMTRVETSNNFITTCQISYLDKFDAFDIETIATIYRAIVGLNVLPENIVANTSKLVDDFSFLFKIKPYLLGKMLTKVVTKSLKKSAENFYITYIGKMPFTPELNEKIADVSFFVWPDSCPCCLAVLDFNGKIKITATENYKNREVMSVFRKELEENNIVCEKIGEGVFSQSRPRLQF